MFETQTETLKAAVDTLSQAAEQQVTDSQARLDDITTKLGAEVVANKDLQEQLAADVALLDALRLQLAQLQLAVTYPDLEWGTWSINDNPVVGGSGNGVASLTPADAGKPAVFSIAPNPVTTGSNYYDAYATQKKKPNAAYKNFYLAAKWDFPSDADMNACHCIEMEARQVFGGRAAVPALQMNFSGNQLRYFDKPNGWVATGVTMPRSRSILAVLEAHRDDSFVYYDAFTINGVRHALTVKEAIFPLAWAERMSVSVQLDAKNTPYKVNLSGAILKVS